MQGPFKVKHPMMIVPVRKKTFKKVLQVLKRMVKT